MADHHFGAPPRNHALIDDAVVLRPRFVSEPEATHELDPIVLDAERHVVPPAVDVDGSDVRHFELFERRHEAPLTARELSGTGNRAVRRIETAAAPHRAHVRNAPK